MPFNEDQCYLGRDLVERTRFDISHIHMRFLDIEIHMIYQSFDAYYTYILYVYMMRIIRKDFFPRDKQPVLNQY